MKTDFETDSELVQTINTSLANAAQQYLVLKENLPAGQQPANQ